ncbi:hypothetical protein A5782_06545 [Mycobacterium sp. 852002-40037_SCH5390672]|nr:hypothetical protein A5782_06545 [Mycobacterium sp. 852002-40037_SCH5390672]
MLKALSQAGIRHLGVDPAAVAADVAATYGVSVLKDFFNASTATKIRDCGRVHSQMSDSGLAQRL